MAEAPRSFEDEAVLYVLDRLETAERREFETRLEKSAELRALVRELGDGAVALALAVPRREPPPQVWRAIDARLTGESPGRRMDRPIWSIWLRNGWAAAAACLLGWLLYALWVHQAGRSSNPSALSANNSELEPAPPDQSPVEVAHVSPPPLAVTNAVRSQPPVSPLARTGEIAALRRQVRELELQVAHLSQVSTQQQALLSESSRFTLFRLLPPNSTGSPHPMAPPPPELQRALLLALARELGWVQTHKTEGGIYGERVDSDGVDFVNLPAANPDPSHEGSTNLSAQSGAFGEEETNPSGTSITGLMFGGNAIFAIPPSIAASGSDLVSVWSGGEFLGTLSVGNNNTTVLTTPSAGSLEGLFLTHGSSTSFNSSNVIFQFPPR